MTAPAPMPETVIPQIPIGEPLETSAPDYEKLNGVMYIGGLRVRITIEPSSASRCPKCGAPVAESIPSDP